MITCDTPTVNFCWYSFSTVIIPSTDDDGAMTGLSDGGLLCDRLGPKGWEGRYTDPPLEDGAALGVCDGHKVGIPEYEGGVPGRTDTLGDDDATGVGDHDGIDNGDDVGAAVMGRDVWDDDGASVGDAKRHRSMVQASRGGWRTMFCCSIFIFHVTRSYLFEDNIGFLRQA